MSTVIIIWFRKGLRLHDNKPLQKAIQLSNQNNNNIQLLPIFCLDPYFVKEARVGFNRWNFLLDCLTDLKASFKQKLGLEFYVFRGNPMMVFKRLFESVECCRVLFEADTEPYAIKRDEMLFELCAKFKVECEALNGHTLFDPKDVLKLNKGSAPLTYQSFLSVISRLPAIHEPLEDLFIPIQCSVPDLLKSKLLQEFPGSDLIPTIQELGLEVKESFCSIHKGGESEALSRMNKYLRDKTKVSQFEKPKTNPCAFNPTDTTCLSPYLKFGCLSVRLLYWKIKRILDEKADKKFSKPPVSLIGQLYWREFYYVVASSTPNYHKMSENPVCLQVEWRLQNIGTSDNSNKDEKDAEKQFIAWKEGKTGYPWIDAIMTQLRQEGWIHHLARHSVACFLTRGDLYISWERGVEVFDELLLDSDYSINVGNWLWLSASAFFHQYFRIYSPISFGKQYKYSEEYIKKYVPVLKNFPLKYLYEPWKAPIQVQKQSSCIIGKDYPFPIIDHEIARKSCMEKMKLAYQKKLYGVTTSNESKKRKQVDT